MKQTSVRVDAPEAISRRHFLKTGSGVLMGTLVAGSGVLATLAPSRTWALTIECNDRIRGQQTAEGHARYFPA